MAKSDLTLRLVTRSPVMITASASAAAMDMLPIMAEETDELDEIRGAARDLWDAMGDPGTPTKESPAAATMRSEYRRLTDAGHTYEEIRDAVGGEILDLAERSD